MDMSSCVISKHRILPPLADQMSGTTPFADTKKRCDHPSVRLFGNRQRAERESPLETGPVATLRLLWLALAVTGLFAVFIFGGQVAQSEEETQVQYLPDDAFYYLVLARNHAALDTWTFDDGTTLTSGFHPLWAHLLSWFEGVRQSMASQALRDLILFSSLVSGGVLTIALLFTMRSRRLYAVIAVVWLAGMQPTLLLTVAAVEWPLVILSALILVLSFLHFHGRLRWCLMLGAGLLGSLARSDFGLLAFCLVIACGIARFLASERATDSRDDLRSALMSLFAAAGGVLAGATGHYVATGRWLQSSALIKTHWTKFEGISPEPALLLLANILGIQYSWSLGPLILLSLLTLGGLGLLAAQIDWRTELGTRAGTLSLTGVLALLGYVVLYAFGADLQPWYSANLLVPCGLTLVTAMTLIGRRIGPRRAEAAFTVIALAALGTNLPKVLPAEHGKGYWPQQTALRAAGEQIARSNLPGPLGAWNAGVLRYSSGRRDLLNLDGLVNNDILEHARSATLPHYIDGMGIQHLVDFRVMIDDPQYRKRGGYDDPGFLDRLEPVTTYVTGSPPPWDQVVVYRIRPAP